ncbi:hypothetical protein MRB53_036988 [Persea americana]|nr:hypothetical protein MRB53_036988 [Persea americana]
MVYISSSINIHNPSARCTYAISPSCPSVYPFEALHAMCTSTSAYSRLIAACPIIHDLPAHAQAHAHAAASLTRVCRARSSLDTRRRGPVHCRCRTTCHTTVIIFRLAGLQTCLFRCHASAPQGCSSTPRLSASSSSAPLTPHSLPAP